MKVKNSGKKRHIYEEHYFKAVIEKSKDVLMLVNQKGNILYASPSIEKLYGRKAEKIKGLRGILYVHPLDIPKVMVGLKDLVINPQKAVTLQLRVRHADGSLKWVEAVGTNLLRDPQIKAIVVNFHDITAFKELEEKKNEFISIASHELKTPITVIKAYAQLLKKVNAGLDTGTFKVIENLNEQVDRMTGLINDLLNVSRIQEGKLVLTKSKFSLDNLLEQVVEQVKIIFPHREIIIKGTIKLSIYADKFRISQVLFNLINNALKYSGKNTKVRINLYKDKRFCIIDINDRGKGIAKKNLNRVFDAFFREDKKVSNSGGLGLGLYISHEIVKMHGGMIEVRSKIGKGSVFKVMLPFKTRKYLER